MTTPLRPISVFSKLLAALFIGAAVSNLKAQCPPPNPTANSVSINCGQTATLNASGGVNYQWFSNAAGSQLVGSGASFVTPALSTNTTYYVASSVGLANGTVFNFTNATATGHVGPTQAQVNAAYSGTNLAGNVSVTGSGFQNWTVPATGTYRIVTRGARGGGSGGQGAVMQGDFTLNAGEVIRILVGQVGLGAAPAGGGGGSFVVRSPYNTVGNVLIVAGGGSGNGNYSFNPGLTSTNGGSGGGAGGLNGAGGAGGTRSAGGGGFLGNGANCTSNASYAGPGTSFVNGGLGGVNSWNCGFAGSNGGFGGGASAGGNCIANGGAGGGFSGGGGSSNGIAGGGGSVNNGTNQVNQQGANAGQGQVTITFMGQGCISALVPVNVTVNLPSAPTANAAVVNCGATATLSASGGTGTYAWYSNAAGTTQVGTGANFTTPQLTANTTYYVGSTSAGGGGAAGTVYTFTNCSATGQFGPTQAQVNSAYSSTNLNGQVTSQSGIQLWTVPSSGTYRIEAFGAQGGGNNQFGRGAQIRGDFALTAGQQIKILVGQQGGFSSSGSGGGGSFVTTSANVPLVVAGGGGGQYDGSSALYNAHAVTVNGGQPTGCASGGAGGNGGNGCTSSGAAAGGGLNTNGTNGTYGTGGMAFVNGGNGGNHGSNAICVGGFGGGGGTHGNTGGGGGGGGYSGGAGGFHNSSTGSGGGGGSYNNGTNQANVGGVRIGHGLVTITSMSSSCVSAVVPVAITVNPPTTPTANNVSINCGNTATLTATNGTGTYYWYSDAAGTQQVGTGASFTTPALVSSTMYYVGTSAGQAGCNMNSLSNILNGVNSNGGAIGSSVPNGYNFTMDGPNGANANYISDGGGDMYDGGNYISTNLGANINYSDGVIANSAAFGAGGQYFTKKLTNMWVLAADVNNISSFSISGNNGADGSGTYNGTTLTVTVGCQTYKVMLKRVYNAGDPSINQMVIIPNNAGATHTWATNTDNTQHDITGLAGTTRLYYLLYAGNSGGFINDNAATNIATTFLTQISATTAAQALCQSNLAPVQVTVNSNIAQPVVSGSTTINCGATSTLTSSTGNNTAWYSSAVGGNLLGTGSTYTTSMLAAGTTLYAVQATINQGSQTFNYTGSQQTWIVPAGVTSINVDVQGAQGGNTGYGTAGLGGRTQATLPVTPGSTIYINVGGQGNYSAGGWNGGGAPYGCGCVGGGGGASDIRTGGTALANRAIVAGGGGGAGYYWNWTNDHGGNGGGLTGEPGKTNNAYNVTYCGQGGTQVAGGAGGTSGGAAGSLGNGGGASYYAGSGGGGYYGGGSGYGGGGGGGGSSFANNQATGVTQTQGFKSGNGLITISWNSIGCASSPVAVPITVNALAAPTSTNAVVGCGTSANLIASNGAGNSYTWFTNSNGTGAVASGANYTTPALTSGTTYYVSSVSTTPGSQSFNYTGSQQTWTVPAGVTSITVDAQGAQGGTSSYGTGGNGGRVQATIPVTPGQTLYVNVGGQGSMSVGGWNGGGVPYGCGCVAGGGGATDIRIGGVALADRKIVAGGGGGAGYYWNWLNDHGGVGGGLTAGGGYTNNSLNPTYCGQGGTQAAGGAGATQGGPAGSLGNGGGSAYYGGSGGGGYYGGGSGYNGGGGGGGSSFTDPTASAITHTQGFKTGNGLVTITWNSAVCVSPLTPVAITVNPLTAPTANNVTINCGQTATITASNNLGAINWYSNANGSTLLVAGANFTTPQLSTTTTYYVGAGTGACATAINPVTVTVNALANPSVNANVTVNCGQTAALTAAGGGGASYTWFSNAAASTQVGTGATWSTPALASTTTYYVTSNTGSAAGTTYSFTNCGATGQFGPTQAQVNAAYTSTNLAGNVTSSNGIQLWTVPSSGTYRIEAFGAQGGGNNQFGRGAQIRGDFALTAGQQLKIIVGQQGGYSNSGSGGGGSFVATSANVPLIVAGGGGGQYSTSSALYNAHAVTVNNGQPSGCTTGGTSGNGGNGCNNSGAAGGGGFNTNGTNGTYGTGGLAFVNGGNGGNHGSNAICVGGFGGGGGTHGNTGGGGAGGGYSGGAGGYHDNNTGSGGGGGSYNNGTNQSNIGGVRTGHGLVTITSLTTPCSSGAVPVTITVNALSAPNVSASAATVNCGQTSVLTAQGGNGTFTWYSNAAGTTQVGTGANFTTPALSATTTYYVASTAAPSCSSALVPMAITVNGPAAPLAANAIVTCGNPTTLTASNGGGIAYTWFTDSLGTQQIGTGSTYTTPSLSSTTTYYVNSGTAMAPAATYTFTNANATGSFGPTQAQLNSAYNGTNLAGSVTSSNGIQLWTVPQTGVYTIDARGARGGTYPGRTAGGNGAQMVGTFNLTAGQQIKILVGQEGYYGGGGGGSFVATSANVPLIVAGGGGGGGSACGGNPPHAGTATNGGNNYNACGYGSYNGGTNGSGGNGPGANGGPGGGFNTNGSPGDGNAGIAFVNGGNGGASGTYYGGFGGGGGSTDDQGAGGGGYSGGAGDSEDGNGGAGGSYNSGTNQSNTAAFQAGNGQVIITRMSSPCVSVVTPVTVTVNAIPAPVVSGTTNLCVNGAANTTLTASGSPSGYTWWTNANGTGQLGTNAAYTTPNINATTTYYVQSVTPQGGSQTFNYTGSAQSFTAPTTGTYTLEAWGAQGGNDPSNPNAIFGGRGGYAKGDVYLTAGQTIQVYVGQQGSGCLNSSWRSTGGGGATDFRLTGGNWNDNAGLLSRILVAGGGGGRHGNNYEGVAYVGNDGGGSTAPNFTANGVNVVGSTQNGGGSSNNTNVAGSFGFSNPTPYSNTCSAGGWNGGARGSDNWANGGGGGGWYGGVSSWPTGSGGSGYAYTAASWIPGGYTPTAAYQLSNTQLIAGNSSMPNPAGGNMTGRAGNGIAKITWSGTGCVSAVTPVTVTVGVAPATNAGPSVVDASTCGKNTVNLGASALAAGESGTWTLLSGTNANGIFSLPTAASTQFTGTYGGSYVLQWAVTNQNSGCVANDTLVVTFNQPIDAVINGLIGTSDLLWCGLTGTDWSTSTNWYQKQATSGLYPNGYYQRMSGAVQPAINSEVFTVSMSNGGMCIGNNNPSLSTNSYAEDVYVGPGITLNLSNDSINIAQNLVNNGTIIASTGITNFTGSSNSIISGSGNTQLFNMRVNKSAGATLTLQQPILVTNNLNMVQGNVFTTSANLLTLGTSSAAPGSLTYNSGTIVGPFKRYFANAASAGTAGLFPVGTAVYNRYADFSFGSGPGVDQFLTVEYKPGAPLQGGIPLYNGLPLMASGSMIQNYSADGYWSVIPTNNNYTAPITSVNYGVTLFANNLTGMQSPQVCRIIKSAGSNTAAQHHVAWQACGTHTPINGAANPQSFLITSTSTQGFSWFNIGTPNSQALPVELLSFNGDCNEGQVNLSWQTATEHNSDYFEVEKSRDGMDWQVLTTVNAAGNSTQLLNYEATDAHAMEGNNYYRLTQVDIDGTTKTYDVINVSCSGAAKGYFSAYPNPSTGSFQVILNDKNLIGSGILSVKDTKGSELLNRTIEVKPGINMFSVTDLNLAPGVYYIQIVNGERATEVLKEVIR